MSSRTPFPPEVEERAIEAGKRAFDDCIGDDEEAWHRARFEAHWSVIADYLRSEEARERAVEAVDDLAIYGENPSVAYVDAVIAALLGEKP